jgi:drug/metabolite transporter (DMT)-like permease
LNGRGGLVALLVLLGAGWGITQPLAKIAVSEGYRHFGIIFWQLAIGTVILGGITFARGRGLPLGPRHLRLYAVIALTGTLIPNAASFQAAVHLPSGIISILLSLVPMFAFPVALALGIDRFRWARLAGLAFGLAGVALIVGPETSLPDPALAVFIPLALVAPLFYAFEGNIVDKWGTGGLDPIQVLFGASAVGLVAALPLAVLTGHFIDPRAPWGAPDAAVVLSSLVHAGVYAGYVWMVGRGGAVFAAQVSYLVTAFGVLWAMAILGERFSATVWLAMLMMFAGLFLVQPRAAADVAAPAPLGNDAA